MLKVPYGILILIVLCVLLVNSPTETTMPYRRPRVSSITRCLARRLELQVAGCAEACVDKYGRCTHDPRTRNGPRGWHQHSARCCTRVRRRTADKTSIACCSAWRAQIAWIGACGGERRMDECRQRTRHRSAADCGNDGRQCAGTTARVCPRGANIPVRKHTMQMCVPDISRPGV